MKKIPALPGFPRDPEFGRRLAAVCSRRQWDPVAIAATMCLETAGTFDGLALAHRWSPRRTGLGLLPLQEGHLRVLGVPRTDQPPPGVDGSQGGAWASWRFAAMPPEDALLVCERYLAGAFAAREPVRPWDYRLAALGAAPGLPLDTRLALPDRGDVSVRELADELTRVMRAPRMHVELGADGVEVPMRATPASASTIAEMLPEMLTRLAGQEPNKAALALLHGQLWLESGRGKSLNNNNPGNYAAGASWTGDFYRPPWFEVTASSSARMKHLHEQMKRGEAPSKFRSYDSLDRGLEAYAKGFAGKFRPIFEAAMLNDAEGMARAINSTGYCPPSDCKPLETARSLASLARELRHHYEPLGLDAGPPPAGSEGPDVVVTRPEPRAGAGKLLVGAGVVGLAGAMFVGALRKPRRVAT